MTTQAQIEATTRLLALRDEMLRNAERLAGTDWWTDRVNEMLYLQGQLEKAGVIPAL